jgi:hypothetical protein
MSSYTAVEILEGEFKGKVGWCDVSEIESEIVPDQRCEQGNPWATPPNSFHGLSATVERVSDLRIRPALTDIAR